MRAIVCEPPVPLRYDESRSRTIIAPIPEFSAIRIRSRDLLPPLVKLGTSATPGKPSMSASLVPDCQKTLGFPPHGILCSVPLRRYRAGEEGDNREDLQTWFLSSRYKDMTYSELIGGLFSTSVEQQNFIREKLRANEPGKSAPACC